MRLATTIAVLAAGQLLWRGVSRAVRAPARLDREITNPLGGNVLGGPNFESEVANVLQLGYRSQVAQVITGSATAYLHDWDKLRSGSAPPVLIENGIEGPVYGVETWAAWRHPEFCAAAGRSRFERSAFVQARWMR